MSDSYGDGWNGGVVVIYEDGVQIDSGLSASFYSAQSAGTFYVNSQSADGGYSESVSFCPTAGSTIEVTYASGSWEGENTYTITDDNTGSVSYTHLTLPTKA